MPRVLAVVLFLVFGWIVGFLGLFVTIVADLVAVVGPGRRLSQTARLGIGVVAFLITVPLANIGRVPSDTPLGTASQLPETATPATAPLAATATPFLTKPPDNATLADAANDMVDVDDVPASSVAYQDITNVRVEARAGDVQLDTWVAGQPPKRDPRAELIAFAWLLDTNADGSPEYQVLIQNADGATEVNAPGWVAVFLDLASGRSQEGSAFPGTLSIIAGQVKVHLPLSAVGSPAEIWAIAATESDIWADYANDPTNDVIRRDYAPDHQYPNGSDWIRVSVGA